MNLLTTTLGREPAMSGNCGLSPVGESSISIFAQNFVATSSTPTQGERARKLLQQTSGIRSANRYTGNWHHCGLNE